MTSISACLTPSRASRTALLYSASLAALLGAAALNANPAAAACPAAPTVEGGTVTITAADSCDRYDLGSSNTNKLNFLLQEGASMITSVDTGQNATLFQSSSAVTKVGNITINGTLQNQLVGPIIFRLDEIGAITFGANSNVSRTTSSTGAPVSLDFRMVGIINKIDAQGTIDMPIGSLGVFGIGAGTNGQAVKNDKVTVTLDVSNSGKVTAAAPFIRAENGEIAGSVTNTNTGKITAVNGFELRSMIVGKDVKNDGTMTYAPGGAGIPRKAGFLIIQNDRNASDNGISSIGWSVLNNGTIQGYNNGFDIATTSIGQDVKNTNTISALQHGILLANSTVGRSVTNTRLITSTGTLTAGISATGSSLGAVSNEGVSGLIENTTTGILLSGTTVFGSVSNDATINANQTGISITASSAVGSVQNKANGKITVTAADADAISIANSNVGTEVSNAGDLKAIRHGISLDTVTGAAAVSNTKLITSDGTLTAGIHVTGSTVASVSNTGLSASISNAVDAIKVLTSTVSNGIGNSGSLTATNDGIFVSGGSVGGESLNSGTITAVRNGISVDGVSSAGTLTTALKNTGTITSTGTLTAGISVTKSKLASVSNDAGGRIAKAVDGISLSELASASPAGTTVSGAVSNGGTILASHTASA